MNLREKVLMRSLQQKQLNEEGHLSVRGDVIETLADQNPTKFRNMCAHVSPEFYEEVDGVCAMLGMSKREFITAALVDAVEAAREIMQSSGLNASYALLATEQNITVTEA